MMTIPTMSVAIQTDAELVGQTLSGNRDAFGQIVARYQSLVCSLAYSATGSLGQSEDLAQETFITAWKRLNHLRERDKLRAWLCGIARNRINNFLRREGREPNHQAESIEEITESHSPEPLPLEYTISKEEAGILWRSLERIPEIYREPLILFYREHQSIEAVAAHLDLSEDAVKQRLSRGRKLLQEQVLAFVEGALERTNPGKVFTIGVLAVLPLSLATSAKAAAIGATAAKGGLLAKSAAVTGILSLVFNPVLILFGNYAGYRMNLAAACSEAERQRIRDIYWNAILVALGVFAVFAGAVVWLCRNPPNNALLIPLLITGSILIYLGSYFVFILQSGRGRKKFLNGIPGQAPPPEFLEPIWEYRSRASFLGLPLVHIRIGDRLAILKTPVKAWIAVGEHAVGGLFAFGAVAIAPFSIGAVAIGLLPFGGLAVGAIAMGGFAIGIWSFGALVLGWQALGACAFGWHSAYGGIAVARDFACGGIAHAAEANNEAARQLTNSSWFFHYGEIIGNHYVWLNLVWVVPMALLWKLAARKNRQNTGQEI
jgi:RNA polymerase sigma factor (sigma-70 family)